MARLNLGTGLRRFIRPETVWSPRRVFASQVRPRRYAPKETVECELPWGSKILVRHDEYIGSVIVSWLLYDLSVCEMIARLSSRGELMVDVGANIGQMTSLLAACAGPKGRVFSFEPHPVIFGQLERSAKSWSPETGHGEVALQMCALGAEAGTASLKEEPNFDVNPGLSSLVGSSEASHAYTVDVRRLDEVLAGEGKVGVMKLDVEDYEMEVLRGATALLASGSIRDIIYEDHNGYPSDLSSFLEGYGYKVFTIKREMLRPLLLAPEGSAAASLNFLATLDPERAKARFRRAGYSALRRKIR